MRDLPEPLQDLYDHILFVLDAHLPDEERPYTQQALAALVEPYRAAQTAYAAGNGLYSPHPAFHVRTEGDKVWTTWPDDKPMPTLMDLMMLVHEKNDDPAKSQEDA